MRIIGDSEPTPGWGTRRDLIKYALKWYYASEIPYRLHDWEDYDAIGLKLRDIMVERLQIANALGRLHPLRERAIELIFGSGLSQEKAAERMGYSRATLQRWVTEAYQEMEAWFWTK